MTLAPNYVDLFDQLYPTQQLNGLADESQINVTQLNSRFAAIRANHASTMRALNGIVSNEDPGKYIKQYLQSFSEIAAFKKFTYTGAQKSANLFTTGFDAKGTSLSFPSPRVVFPVNDLGGTPLSNVADVMVFHRGHLLPPSLCYVNYVQGGMMVYVKASHIYADADTYVVVVRKFNQLGVSHTQRFAAVANAAVGANFAITVPSLSPYGRQYDIRYYKLFRRRTGWLHFAAMDPSEWTARLGDDGSSAIFTVLAGAELGEQFQVVNCTEYWSYEYEGLKGYLTPNYLNLIMSDGTNPAPVNRIEDIDVWLCGRLMRPGIDYTYTRGGNGAPPRLFFVSGIPVNEVHLKVVSNVPYDSEYNIEQSANPMPHVKGIADFSVIGSRKMRTLEGMGWIFSEGFLDGCGDGVMSVLDNAYLHYKGLVDRDYFMYRARYVLTASALALVDSVFDYKSQERRVNDMLVQAVGVTFDPVAAYIANNSTPNVPGRTWPSVNPLWPGYDTPYDATGMEGTPDYDPLLLGWAYPKFNRGDTLPTEFPFGGGFDWVVGFIQTELGQGRNVDLGQFWMPAVNPEAVPFSTDADGVVRVPFGPVPGGFPTTVIGKFNG